MKTETLEDVEKLGDGFVDEAVLDEHFGLRQLLSDVLLVLLGELDHLSQLGRDRRRPGRRLGVVQRKLGLEALGNGFA